ncbi:Bud site selection protein, Revert to axial protein 1 [Mortierella sp. AM989]|nr:Bud site selection protein, Revert to axial protein 1 [Mortierella sp. AM989]
MATTNHSTFFNTFLNPPNNTTTTTTNMSGANSLSNTSSSFSATSSAISRKLPPHHLEAIQTQKAQASTNFRPVSTVQSSEDMNGSHSQYPSHTSLHSQEHSAGSGIDGIITVYSELPPMSATTANDSYPFTPSTLVGAVHSPMENHHEYPAQHPQAHARTSGSLARHQLQQQDVSSSDNTPYRASMSSNNQSRHAHDISSSNNNRNGIRYSTSKQQGSQGMDLINSSSSNDPQFQHLPTLWQILHRKTLPPVCLFNFYLYMRDCEKSSEEVDFWLDVTAHEILWRLYVRATKRRQTVAAQERAKKEERGAEEREAARLEAERWKAQMEEEHEKEQLKKGHQQKPSLNLAMYEPHWSAANRYLEMSEVGSDNFSNVASMTDATSTYNQQHQSSDMTQLSTLQDSEPIILPQNSSSASLPSQNVTERKVPDLPDAVPNNWSHLEETSQNKLETGAGAGLSTNTSSAEMAESSGEKGKGLGTAVAGHPSGTLGTSTTKSTSNKRNLTSGAYGVTKEDLLRSAERIYCKYLIPQAEKPVRIPGSVRHRVALLMDTTMMNRALSGTATNKGAGGHAATLSSLGTEAALKRKNGVESRSENAQSSSMASLTSPKNKRLGDSKSQSNSNGCQKQGVRQSTISQCSVQQPDQDVGLVFAEAREIVFDGMESYYFPRFLQARAYGNMVHSHRVARVILGLLILFIGFVIVLCMIFTNLRPRSMRAWAFIPIFLGILLCTTFQFNICPLMVAFGVSETKWMQFAKIEEPFILIVHRKRAVKVLVVAVLYTICVGIVFGLVPGHRL